MAALREVATSLGYTQVGTLINSGNLVYRGGPATPGDDARRLHDAIAAQLGVTCTVFVRTREQLASILRECPMHREAAADPSHLLVTVWDDRTTATMREAFVRAPVVDERFVLGAQAMYCWLPKGIATSVVYEKASRALGDHITARNWSTMQKILARLEAMP